VVTLFVLNMGGSLAIASATPGPTKLGGMSVQADYNVNDLGAVSMALPIFALQPLDCARVSPRPSPPAKCTAGILPTRRGTLASAALWRDHAA
jgi:hypothetical protein